MRKIAKRTGEEDEIVDGPAVVGADHVRDRILKATAGSKAGWSRLTVYERAFRLGQLLCKEHCTSAALTREEEGRALDIFVLAADPAWRRAWPRGASIRVFRCRSRPMDRSSLCSGGAVGKTRTSALATFPDQSQRGPPV